MPRVAYNPRGLQSCLMPGDLSEAGRSLCGIQNVTLSSLESVLPASKAELRTKTTNLQTEITDVQAKNAEDRVLINNLVIQVNKLTPVSV